MSIALSGVTDPFFHLRIRGLEWFWLKRITCFTYIWNREKTLQIPRFLVIDYRLSLHVTVHRFPSIDPLDPFASPPALVGPTDRATAASSRDRVELRHPGHLEHVFARVAMADQQDIVECADAAAGALPAWSSTPLRERARILTDALERMEAQRDRFVRTITMENGKPVRESEAEFRSTLTDARFQIRHALLAGDLSPVTGGDGQRVGEILSQPLGLTLLITPWNYPLATVLRKLIPALLWGNTAICKPAEQTPLSPLAFLACLADAGLPDGVVRLLVADGPTVLESLAEDPRLKGISFTGSTAAGRRIAERVGSRDIRLQLEMGGKNAMVVLADADLDAAVSALRVAAFTNAGQWCLATSCVLVQEEVYEPFCRKLVDAVRALKVGNGFDPGVTMGPLTTARQHATALEAARLAHATGCEPLLWTPPGDIGGHAHSEGSSTGTRAGSHTGRYMPPAIFGRVPDEAQLAQEEVFGPVLALSTVRDPDEALRRVNASPYGLSFSVWTADDAVAERFLREAACGSVHHNLHTGHRHAAMPVTGWKESGRGLPECGHYAKEFYTKAKAVYR